MNIENEIQKPKFQKRKKTENRKDKSGNVAFFNSPIQLNVTQSFDDTNIDWKLRLLNLISNQDGQLGSVKTHTSETEL